MLLQRWLKLLQLPVGGLSVCCRRSRGLAPSYARPSLISEEMALGSSYSLSHGSSRDKDGPSSSGHSWFGWLKGDSGSSSSRERSGDQADGGLGVANQAVDKPRNEHEEVQVGTPCDQVTVHPHRC